MTFNQPNLRPGRVKALARPKDAAINFSTRLETFHAPYFGAPMMGPEDLENVGAHLTELRSSLVISDRF